MRSFLVISKQHTCERPMTFFSCNSTTSRSLKVRIFIQNRGQAYGGGQLRRRKSILETHEHCLRSYLRNYKDTHFSFLKDTLILLDQAQLQRGTKRNLDDIT